MQIVFVPFMDRTRFAELVGVSDRVVEGWIREGRLKVVQMGKRSLVDLRNWLELPAAPQSVAGARKS